MVEKLIICTFDKLLFDLLNQKLINVSSIETKYCNTPKLFKSKEFDVINTPTTFMESFNSKAMDMDCQIIETGNKWDLPDFVVTSPNFKIPSNLTKLQMGLYQLEIPLKKVQEYFNDRKIIYAIHTEFSFAYFDELNDKLIENILFLLKNILKQ